MTPSTVPPATEQLKRPKTPEAITSNPILHESETTAIGDSTAKPILASETEPITSAEGSDGDDELTPSAEDER